MVSLLNDAMEDKRTVFIAGNGGSAASASHMCEDLAKGTGLPIRVVSLTDNTPYITALANDEGYENIFTGQLRTMADPGDFLIVISGSGNSRNIVKAVEWAKSRGLETFGLLGFDGGKLASMVDGKIHVRCDDMGMVEAIHGVIWHYVVDRMKGKC